jgi:hypothetical protein
MMTSATPTSTVTGRYSLTWPTPSRSS